MPADPFALGAPCQLWHVADVVWPRRGSVPGTVRVDAIGRDDAGVLASPAVTRYGFRPNASVSAARTSCAAAAAGTRPRPEQKREGEGERGLTACRRAAAHHGLSVVVELQLHRGRARGVACRVTGPATSWCSPSLALALSQTATHGSAEAVAMGAPSSVNETETTPTSSVACAESSAWPDTRVPSEGEVTATAGGSTSIVAPIATVTRAVPGVRAARGADGVRASRLGARGEESIGRDRPAAGHGPRVGRLHRHRQRELIGARGGEAQLEPGATEPSAGVRAMVVSVCCTVTSTPLTAVLPEASFSSTSSWYVPARANVAVTPFGRVRGVGAEGDRRGGVFAVHV